MTPSYLIQSWSLTVNTQAGPVLTIDSKPQAPLRIVFRVEAQAVTKFWSADIEIYNLNNATTSLATANQWNWQSPTQLGDAVVLSAGYKYGPSGTFDPAANMIFQGNVFQPYQTRKNVTDWTVMLRCTLGLFQLAFNKTNINVPASSNDYETVRMIADASGLALDSVDEAALSQRQHPRGQTVYGRPSEALQQIAKDNNLTFWISPDGINIRSLNFNDGVTPAYAYAPINLPGQYAPQGTTTGLVKSTIIGTPEQTQMGVTFRVLMDAQPKIGDVVQIAPGTTINRLPFQFGQQFPAVTDPNGLYVVAGLRHYGDSRGHGDDWYTEITALNKTFFPVLPLPASPNPN